MALFFPVPGIAIERQRVMGRADARAEFAHRIVNAFYCFSRGDFPGSDVFSFRNNPVWRFCIPFCVVNCAVKSLVENVARQKRIIVIDVLGVNRSNALGAAGRIADNNRSIAFYQYVISTAVRPKGDGVERGICALPGENKTICRVIESDKNTAAAIIVNIELGKSFAGIIESELVAIAAEDRDNKRIGGSAKCAIAVVFVDRKRLVPDRAIGANLDVKVIVAGKAEFCAAGKSSLGKGARRCRRLPLC